MPRLRQQNEVESSRGHGAKKTPAILSQVKAGASDQRTTTEYI